METIQRWVTFQTLDSNIAFPIVGLLVTSPSLNFGGLTFCSGCPMNLAGNPWS